VLGARTHAWELPHAAVVQQLPCRRAVVREVGGVGTHAAQRWVTSECSGLWLEKYKQIASQSPG